MREFVSRAMVVPLSAGISLRGQRTILCVSITPARHATRLGSMLHALLVDKQQICCYRAGMKATDLLLKSDRRKAAARRS
jgi:hypothetical protein